MRADEFLNEAYKNMRGVLVDFNSHAYERLEDRNISEEMLYELAKKIFQVKNKFKQFDPNQKFTIWSKSLNHGIGLRRRSDADGLPRVEVMSVINKLFDNPDPVFIVG